MTPSEFKKQQIFAKEFAHEEEIFYQNQLRDGMRQGFFENSTNLEEDQQAPAAQPQPQARLISAIEESPARNAVEEMDHEMFGESDQELIGGTRAMRNRRDARLGNQRRRLVRTDGHPEEVDHSMDDEEFKSANSNG